MGKRSEEQLPKHSKNSAATKQQSNGAGDEEYELLYSKDNVSVHPTPSERINGQLRLIKQGFSVFLTWIPYSQNAGEKQKGTSSRTTDRDRKLYTIRAVSLAEMKSIRRQTPPFGWQYIIIVLTNGLAFPPLYFHNGGIREFLGTLREHSLLVRAGDDPNVYLVNDIQDPLQKSLASLDIAEVPRASFAPSLETKEEIMAKSASVADDLDQLRVTERRQPARQRDPAHDFSLQVLEKFSMVTKFARDTTAQIIDNLNADSSKRPSTLPMEPMPLDLGKSSIDEKPEPENSTATPLQQHGDGEASTNVGTFELVDGTQDDSPALVWGKARPPPLGDAEWAAFLDEEGRVTDPKALRKRIFYGGIEPALRSLVWKFLLEFYPFESTSKEREALISKRREDYNVLKAQWQSVSNEQAKRFSKFRERKSRIEKDVVRTDRSTEFYAEDDNPNVAILRDILITYSFYNFDLGYCQGMSDLLSPILYIMRDEADAFWSFAALMERLGPNFHRDQNGMHSQLLALSKLVQLLDPPLQDYFKQVDCLNYFFCFRWILIQFKREFEFEDVLRLWEVLWSRHLSEHFHLYMCVALLKRHRRKIMDEQMEFDTLLKFINELSGHIDLVATLRDAEALCLFAGEEGVACIPPGTPPALSTVL